MLISYNLNDYYVLNEAVSLFPFPLGRISRFIVMARQGRMLTRNTITVWLVNSWLFIFLEKESLGKQITSRATSNITNSKKQNRLL